MSTDPSQGQTPAPARLHAPWRMNYLESMGTSEKASGVPTPGSGSFLLDYWASPESDARNHVIVRSQTGLIVLNKYPYASGHLLIALGEARPTLLDYSPRQRADFWSLVDLASAIVTLAVEPQGLNIGINQGRAAGAGVPQHLHAHVVPRWGGDVNFMTSIGQVRVDSCGLDAMRDRCLRVLPAARSLAGLATA